MKQIVKLLKKRSSRNYLLIALLITGVSMAAMAYAGSVAVPYAFTGGDTAKSAEVNDNFTHLADRSWDLSGNGSGSDLFFNTGKVGIGTQTPGAELDIQSGNKDMLIGMHKFKSDHAGSPENLTFSIPGASQKVYYMFSADGYYNDTRSHDVVLSVYGKGNKNDYIALNHNGSYGRLSTGPGENLILEAGSPSSPGKVGIGTENPVGALDVNGTIYQRGSQLHADYVFESDYKIESIEKHAEFMWNQKHLKAVPKARKDENGKDIVEYGSHMRGILEELEKAHVYISQLNDVINKQQKTIGILSEKVDALTEQKQ